LGNICLKKKKLINLAEVNGNKLLYCSPTVFLQAVFTYALLSPCSQKLRMMRVGATLLFPKGAIVL